MSDKRCTSCKILLKHSHYNYCQYCAHTEIARLQSRLAAAEADAGRWMDVSVDGYPDKACEVLIARGNATVFGAWIGDSFWYSNEKVAALFWRHLPKPPDPARGVE